MRLAFACFAAMAVLVTTAAGALAQATLPGGATSLSETHGDWLVKCAIVPEATAPVCAMSQEQAQTESGQRVLAIEIQPLGDRAVGTLVLPFGLDLGKGAALGIDDGAPFATLAFRTCLPGGCLVTLDLAPELVAALRVGSALKVTTVADGGQATPFTISLTGFAGALDRTTSLMAPAQ